MVTVENPSKSHKKIQGSEKFFCLLPICYLFDFRDFMDRCKLLILMEPTTGIEPVTY